MNVREKADAIGTFRFIEVRLMETAAFWTPLTPEMEVKVLFGRHIWNFAQHADWLGKRTFELRQPEHYTRTPAGDYLALLNNLKEALTTADRLGLLYDVVMPGLIRRYQAYLEATDHLLDEPSVVIIERILRELERQRQEANQLRGAIGVTMTKIDAFAGRESAIPSVVA